MKILEQILTEDQLYEKFIDLALGFDQLVGLSMRNSVSLSQIELMLAMESNAERIHNEQNQRKEKEHQKMVKL